VVEGLLPRRAELYAAPVVYKLTNYDVIPRDLDLIRPVATRRGDSRRGQRIKNWKTRTAQSVKQLDSKHASC